MFAAKFPAICSLTALAKITNFMSGGSVYMYGLSTCAAEDAFELQSGV